VHDILYVLRDINKKYMKYETQKFNIPELKGMSQKSIDEHYALYEGYVKHTNLILEEIERGAGEGADAYKYSEMRRRLSFEFDGMRNHEFYFRGLEGGARAPDANSNLYEAITESYGSFDAWKTQFIGLAKTRGVGWAMLYFDKDNGGLISSWVDEQHFGHLTGLSPILGLDMWEHAFVGDYWPSGKGQYIEDFFENLNWGVIEANFKKAL
jgi:Fe-Mn family superoxide dismutase